MSPEQAKEALAMALSTNDGGLALQAAKAITTGDYFVGYPADLTAKWSGDLARVLTHDGRCNKCGHMIPKGAKAIWIKGKGVWHTDHYLRSLA